MPQLAQLIDCIVNVVCHMSVAESRSEYVAAGRGVVGVLWRGRQGSPESTIEQPSCEKEKRGESEEKRFGGNDVSADRGFASTSQQQNSNKT